jgi:predicted dehydrogenase
MIHPACPLGVLAVLLPAVATVVSGAPAPSQQVPVVAPGHEQLAPAAGAPTAQIGVAVRRLGGQPLDHDFRALQGRELRLREELHDFVTAARSGLPSATASLNPAIEGLRIAEAIVESARSGQTVTLMPR